jgi:hypothetical protein
MTRADDKAESVAAILSARYLGGPARGGILHADDAQSVIGANDPPSEVWEAPGFVER